MKEAISIRLFALFAVALTVPCAPALAAGPGSLDTGFGNGGKVTTSFSESRDQVNSLALQRDGKIVLAGYSDNGTKNNFALVRYNADGSLDTTFDSDGKVTTAIGSNDDGALSMVVQGDGKILTVGYSNN